MWGLSMYLRLFPQDKKPMRNGDMTQLGEVLELTAVTEEDTADYLCEASNVAGTVDDIIQLLVRCKSPFNPSTAGAAYIRGFIFY